MEHNIKVLNDIFFWADTLSQRTPSIDVQLSYKTVLVIEKSPLSEVAPFAILDDPAVCDDSEEVSQLPLFESMKEEDNDTFYI